MNLLKDPPGLVENPIEINAMAINMANDFQIYGNSFKTADNVVLNSRDTDKYINSVSAKGTDVRRKKVIQGMPGSTSAK